MSRLQVEEEDPPGQVIRIPPADRRDFHGRTLDQALYEDRVVREAEWERRLQRAYQPFFLLDWVIEHFGIGMILVIMVRAFAGQSGLNGWIEQGFRLLILWGVAFPFYRILYAKVLMPRMHKRLDGVRAAARAEGFELTGDPMGQCVTHKPED